MPLPFFCAICDKPILPTINNKYPTIHKKCMDDYLAKFSIKSANKKEKKK
tara:strand:+ start:318 stop:467 length:150 start_codon:yes stop_codon:yes gene_type:complete